MKQRENISFSSHGAICRGWFFHGGDGMRPCIVMAHGFGGVKEMRLDAYAERFADEGYHVLVFDYRHFGESDGHPRQLLSIAKQHEDWRAAIEYVRTRNEVDKEKIILWGTSFSGGHVAALATEGRFAAVISQVPHLNGIATALASPFVANIRLALAALIDVVKSFFGKEPYYVDIVAAPGKLGAMTAPGALEGVMRLIPQGLQYNQKVAARIFLSIPFYSPARRAKKILCPWLVQVAKLDLTTPAKPAIKAVACAQKGELILYDCDHFDVYVEPCFEKVVADQISFLRRCVSQ
ncbi:MAG: alpha/beta hydrolase [Spirochaetes bacterium]|nr:alpha/beta hydrolase [Spirochaetota bacterium]